MNKRRSKGPGVEFKLRDMGHVFHVNISKCSFPTHMSRPAFTPSNKTPRGVSVGCIGLRIASQGQDEWQIEQPQQTSTISQEELGK